MIIIPAIDLKGGQCVRLAQGQMDKATVYSPDPVAIARGWAALGARRIHLVDLDGAVTGEPVHADLIRDIRSAVPVRLEVGGGIRTISTVQAYLSAGVDYVILGSAAIKNPELLAESCRRFPGRIIVGIDARDGMVSIEGWTETTPLRAVDCAQRLNAAAVAAIIYTDISRDGMLTGPNIESTVRLARATTIPVIASGGVSSLRDIDHVLAAESAGIAGVIIGRALYTGDIDLKECLARAAEAAGRARG